MPDETDRLYFQFFTEIAIIAQLSRTLLERRLPDGVTMAHFSVISHLVRRGDGQTPMKIADAFQTPKTSLTHTLAGLEARGLIEMRANPEDGRSKQVWVTSAGRALMEQAMTGMSPDIDDLAQAFAPAEMAGLLPDLSRIRAILDAARD